ncbi:hypothetical protein ONZ45_g17741 [Pleurotus djamor]|nr:hypothetical protein ONZ45_g17741 [Pleurotus djamor]
MQVTAALLRRHVIAVVLFWVHLSSALLKNVTIDDSRGDELSGAVPAYVPDGGWTDQSTRYVTLDNSRLHLGTHHDTTAHAVDPTKQITFSFTGEYSSLIELPSIRLTINIGVALYIYCILANNPHPDTLPFDRLAQYKFFMDGQDAGSFRHDPDPNTQDYIYNALVFRADGLPNKQHDFKIQLDPSQAPVLILFDYAVYTVS